MYIGAIGPLCKKTANLTNPNPISNSKLCTVIITEFSVVFVQISMYISAVLPSYVLYGQFTWHCST